MKVTPLNNNILVEVSTEADETKGGIMVPKTQGEKTEAYAIFGKIAAISKQMKIEDTNSEYSVGSKVLVKKWEGQDVSINGKKHILIEPQHVMALVE